MQKIISYHSQYELLQFDFISRNTQIICPNPSIADDIRKRIPSNKKQILTTLTISRFVGDLLKSLSPDTKILKKSELMLELSVVWKAKFSQLPDNTFFNIFNLVTELRSFTLKLDLLEEVLDDYDKETSEVIQWFYHYIENREINDEHSSYAILNNIICDPNTSLVDFADQSFIFLGFTHLSSGQIDFINSIGRDNDVYLPIPSMVLKKAKRSDWVKWIESDGYLVEEVGVENTERSLNYSLITKNRLSEGYLKLEKDEFLDIFLATKSPSFAEVSEIADSRFNYKVESDSLKIKSSSIFKEMKDLFFKKLESDIHLENILEYLDCKIPEIIKKEDFISLKILTSFRNELVYWNELSEINSSLKYFDFLILEMILTLNLPRLYNVPQFKERSKGSISGLEGLWGYERERQSIVCVTSEYPGLRSNSGKFSEEISNFLSAFGPIRSQALDFEFIKSQLIEVLSSKRNVLLIENSISERDIPWNEIWEYFSFKKEMTLSEKDNKEIRIIDPLEKWSKQSIKDKALYKLSPSRIQTFIECPRKYFFTYIEPLPRGDQISSILTAADLGEVEHLVVEKYIENYSLLNDQNHFETVEKNLKVYLKKNQKELDFLSYKGAFIEVSLFTKRMILELLKLKKIDANAKLTFEVPLTGENISGRVDFVLESEILGKGIFDFKRSSSSIPTASEFEKKKKIQLWFYLFFQSKLEKEINFFGYLSMADPEESLIYVLNENIKEQLEKVEFFSKVKIRLLKEEIMTHFADFELIFDNVSKQLLKIEKYLALPESTSVCLWCPVKNLCPKVVGE